MNEREIERAAVAEILKETKVIENRNKPPEAGYCINRRLLSRNLVSTLRNPVFPKNLRKRHIIGLDDDTDSDSDDRQCKQQRYESKRQYAPGDYIYDAREYFNPEKYREIIAFRNRKKHRTEQVARIRGGQFGSRRHCFLNDAGEDDSHGGELEPGELPDDSYYEHEAAGEDRHLLHQSVSSAFESSSSRRRKRHNSRSESQSICKRKNKKPRLGSLDEVVCQDRSRDQFSRKGSKHKRHKSKQKKDSKHKLKKKSRKRFHSGHGSESPSGEFQETRSYFVLQNTPPLENYDASRYSKPTDKSQCYQNGLKNVNGSRHFNDVKSHPIHENKNYYRCGDVISHSHDKRRSRNCTGVGSCSRVNVRRRHSRYRPVVKSGKHDGIDFPGVTKSKFETVAKDSSGVSEFSVDNGHNRLDDGLSYMYSSHRHQNDDDDDDDDGDSDRSNASVGDIFEEQSVGNGWTENDDGDDDVDDNANSDYYSSLHGDSNAEEGPHDGVYDRGSSEEEYEEIRYTYEDNRGEEYPDEDSIERNFSNEYEDGASELEENSGAEDRDSESVERSSGKMCEDSGNQLEENSGEEYDSDGYSNGRNSNVELSNTAVSIDTILMPDMKTLMQKLADRGFPEADGNGAHETD